MLQLPANCQRNLSPEHAVQVLEAKSLHKVSQNLVCFRFFEYLNLANWKVFRFSNKLNFGRAHTQKRNLHCWNTHTRLLFVFLRVNSLFECEFAVRMWIRLNSTSKQPRVLILLLNFFSIFLGFRKLSIEWTIDQPLHRPTVERANHKRLWQILICAPWSQQNSSKTSNRGFSNLNHSVLSRDRQLCKLQGMCSFASW